MNRIRSAPWIMTGSLACILSVLSCNLSGLFAQAFSLSCVSDLKRVFEDAYNLPDLYDEIELWGIRGEVISGQLVIAANQELTGVMVEIGALEHRTGNIRFPASAIAWNFVGSIPLSENAPDQPRHALVRPAPALFPEYLVPEKKIGVPGGEHRAIWLTVQIPESAAAGTYSGRVTVRCKQGEQSIPLRLTVYPFTIPDERHLDVVEWHNTSGFKRFHGIAEDHSADWFRMLRIYAENMAAHRQNVFRVPLNSVKIVRVQGNELIFDFSLFDSIANVFWSTGKMDYLETGFLTRFGEGDWFSTEILLKDITVEDSDNGEPITLPGEEVVPFLLPALESHLRKKGWLEKTLFHVKDEPSIHNAREWMKMSEYMHRVAPDLRRIDAIETTYLLEDIDVAVPKIDALGSWFETYKRWQEQGGELWFYTVGIYQGTGYPNKTIDVPLIQTRIMHWMNFRYGITGYLHWGWNQWNEDPYRDVGMHIGDAWHVYPTRDGVLNSLRWEQMRNGIQDFEYLWLLQERVGALRDSLGSRFNWIDPGHRSREIAGQVVQGLIAYADDPAVLYGAKREIIRELLEFDTSPRIYIQMDPEENSVMTSRSSVALMGWTEPGTRIVVNGTELPVSEQGLFMEQYTLPEEAAEIRVVASGPDGTREIVRRYTVIH